MKGMNLTEGLVCGLQYDAKGEERGDEGAMFC